MDLIYRVDWRKEDTGLQAYRECSCTSTVAWSSRGLVAFTCPLPSRLASTLTDGRSQQAMCFVDVDQPWEVVCSPAPHEVPVSLLRWDNHSSSLLSIDERGRCCLWTMQDNFTNVWVASEDILLPGGKKPLACCWLQPDCHVTLCKSAEAILSSPWNDAFTRPAGTRHIPRSTTGWMTILKNGLLCCIILNDSSPPATSTVPLLMSSSQFTAADVVPLVGKNEDSRFLAAIAGMDLCIHLLLVTPLVHTVNFSRHCRLVVEPFRVIDVRANSVGLASQAQLSWLALDVTVPGVTDVYTALSDSKGSVIQCWQSSLGSGAVQSVLSGQHTSLSLVSAIAKPSATASLSTDGTSADGCGSFLLLATADREFTLLHRRSLVLIRLPGQMVDSLGQVLSSGCDDTDCLSAVAFSPSSCCAVAITSRGTLLMYDCLRVMLPPTVSDSHRQSYLLQLLVRALLSKWECWDIVACITMMPGASILIEQLLSMWDQAFASQPAGVQEFLWRRHQSFKMDMLYCCSNIVLRSASIHCQAHLLLNSIVAWLRSQLPASVTLPEEQWPVSRLARACSNPEVTSLDEAFQMVSAADLLLPPEMLLAIRPLLHWVILYTLQLVQQEHVPLSAQHPSAASALSTSVLVMLREVLLLMRIWNPEHLFLSPMLIALPDTMQVLPILFKQVTKLWWQRLSLSQQSDLQDDGPFLPLPDGVVPPATPGGHLSRMAGCVSSGKCAHYVFREPPCQNIIPLLSQPLCDPYSPTALRPAAGLSQPMEWKTPSVDIVQQVYLEQASQPQLGLRRCNRCWSLSSILPLPSLSGCQSWLDCWSRACVCGGSWQLIASVPPAQQ